MTKVGIGSVYKDLDKAWVGVGGVWKEIEKMWAGVGGVWKEVDGLKKTLEYLGVKSPLSTTLNDCATSNGEYGLISGYQLNTINAYSKSLIRSIPTALSYSAHSKFAARAGDYALFAGGMARYGDQYEGYTYQDFNTVNAYNTSLVRSMPTNLSQYTHLTSGISFNSYGIFAGGRNMANKVVYNMVDVYNASLTRTSAAGLSVARRTPEASCSSSHAIFLGGEFFTGGDAPYSDAYNASLTKVSSPVLPLRRNKSATATTSDGNYALFMGGYAVINNAWTSIDIVHAYDTSLTLSTPSTLSEPMRANTATTVEDYVLVGGGVGSTAVTATMNYFDNSLVRFIAPNLSEPRAPKAITVGNYAVFMGPLAVDVYTSI